MSRTYILEVTEDERDDLSRYVTDPSNPYGKFTIVEQRGSYYLLTWMQLDGAKGWGEAFEISRNYDTERLVIRDGDMFSWSLFDKTDLAKAAQS